MKIIFEVIEKSKSNESLLNKVKKMSIGQLLLAYEHTGDIISRAEGDITFLGHPRGFEEIKKEIEEVSIDDVQRAVNEYLKPEQILTTMLAPKDFVAD
jgi:predicted Zn-dependent peptidase